MVKLHAALTGKSRFLDDPLALLLLEIKKQHLSMFFRRRSSDDAGKKTSDAGHKYTFTW